jgi:hypothetical protein
VRPFELCKIFSIKISDSILICGEEWTLKERKIRTVFVSSFDIEAWLLTKRYTSRKQYWVAATVCSKEKTVNLWNAMSV